MGARRSRQSRSRLRDRHRYGSSRPHGVRPPLPVIVVVCDDAKTAVSYLNILKRDVKRQLTLTVVPSPSAWAAADDILAEAVRQKASLQEQSARDETDQESIWALVDLEQSAERREQAKSAKAKGEKIGISVALSDPCYDLWTLLHLVDTGEEFMDCSAVIARIEPLWKRQFGQSFGHKGQADYTKIMPFVQEAVERARRHHKANDPSWTEVYRLIEEIRARS